jgi:hypothetical protein
MNWIEQLDVIYRKLEKAGFNEIKQELFEAQLSGGTGGEIFLLVASSLIKIKKEKILVYLIIKDEVDSILEYGMEIGYLTNL